MQLPLRVRSSRWLLLGVVAVGCLFPARNAQYCGRDAHLRAVTLSKMLVFSRECIVVIDGANVACQKDGQVTIPKLAAAIAYFRSFAAGRYPIKCVAFAPNFWLNQKPTPGSANPRENGAMETDDWALLNALVRQDHVILTPSQASASHAAHDDFYVIDYAVKYDGFIVTNDMFRDHVSHKVRVPFHRRVVNFQPSASSLPAEIPALTTLTSNTAQPMSSLQRKPSSSGDRDSTEESNPDGEEEEGAANGDGMVVDHAGSKRKKNIDLSEVTYYKVPREFLPMLHGEGGETMEKFQEYTGTYIVLPSHATLESPSPRVRPPPEVLTLSIYGYQKAQQAFQQQQYMQQYSHAQSHVPANYYQQQHAAGNSGVAPQDEHMMDIDPY
ncbi:hypothetical protein BBJ28_00010823 [Nothophytophthora sp. Chile5]|nr:hypothetical protein BBJ28_00010823 [Nothophytophthora sp. Chile5]